MSVNGILSLSEQLIPVELTDRVQSSEWLVGFVLFGAFISLAIARFRRAEIYQNIILANGKIQGIAAFVKETMPLGKPSSLFLLVNYVLSTGVICYMLARESELIQFNYFGLVFLIPVILLIWNLGSFYLTRLLTGESGIFIEPIIFKLIGAQLLGVVYFVLALVFFFNVGNGIMMLNLTIGIFLIESLLRIFKSISTVLGKGVSLYYIILYFCTLEILPILMVYYAITEDFS